MSQINLHYVESVQYALNISTSLEIYFLLLATRAHIICYECYAGNINDNENGPSDSRAQDEM